MELTFCSGHKRPCYLKTGTKDGPNKGKSYYICGNGAQQCDHIQQASVPVTLCPKHEESIIELQTIALSKNNDEKRHFFRCNEGRREKKNWCGYHVMATFKDKENASIVSTKPPVKHSAEKDSLNRVPLKDSTNCIEDVSGTKKVSKQDDDDCILVSVTSNTSGGPPNDVSHQASKHMTADGQLDRIVFHKSKPTVSTHKERSIPVAHQTHREPEQSDSSQSTADIQWRDTSQKVQSSDLVLKDELQRKLDANKNLLKTVEIGKLPDGGKKLKEQIDGLEKDLEKLTIKLKSRTDGEQTCIVKEGMSVIEGQRSLIKQPMESQSKMVSLLPQTPTGTRMKQTTLASHVVKAPDFQQMFSANPQAMTLYGGRMTQARLREVGSVTTAAIDTIHKQLETCPSSTTEATDPKHLRVNLMTHQRQALEWMSWREKQIPPGGILADDMGLGKTLTLISLIMKERETRLKTIVERESAKEEYDEWTNKAEAAKKLKKLLVKSESTLVVCPASLVHQWAREIEKRVKSGVLEVLVYHGPNRDTSITALTHADIVLTTYNIISKEVGIPEDMKKNKNAQDSAVRDQDEITSVEQPVLLRIGWKRIILDEAHNIKNHRSLMAMSVCRLRAQCRWALTGTPIHNDLLDMYSLLRFLRCSPFDEYRVWKKQVDNKSANGTKRLNTLITSLLLRRTKDQYGPDGKPLVALPQKKIYSHEIHLSKEERQVYDLIFAQSRSVLVNYLEKHEESSHNPSNQSGAYKNGASSSQMTSSAITNQEQRNNSGSGGQILLLLLRLRQCCCHLSLLKNALPDDEANSEGIELNLEEQMRVLSLEKVTDTSEPKLTTEVDGAMISSATSNETAAAKMSAKKVDRDSILFKMGGVSTKITALMKELNEIHQMSDPKQPFKSVIISQWTSMLDIVAFHLKQVGLKYFTIQGNIPPKKRTEAVDDFNSNPDGTEVMLVSLRAGGVGLNLIGGNHLFLLDMHWNPALEQQACDRIYRVGQKNDVHIHRYVCKDTVEERILSLQEKKLSLARDVLTGVGTSSGKLTLSDLRMLFGV